MRKVLCGLTLLAIVLPLACGRKADPPASQPAAQAGDPPASAPTHVAFATTGPAELLVSDEPITFDRVRLEAEADGDGTHVDLTADSTQAGQTASFQISGTIADCGPDDLDGKSLKRIVDPASEVQIADGLMLNDGAIEMKPRDVTVEFSATGSGLTAMIRGTLQRDGVDDTTSASAVWRLEARP